MARMQSMLRRRIDLLVFLVISNSVSFGSSLSQRNTTILAPIVAEPSQYWDGNDGPWSTFILSVGTPTQNVRVLIATAGQETWVVLPEGCMTNDPAGCAELRGGKFLINASSTWESTTTIWNNTGLYELGNDITLSLGLTGNGEYGFDSVGLNWEGGGPKLNHTIVAGIATKDFYLGQFGISPRSTNFTVSNDNSSSLTDPQPSYLSLLKQNNLIPSLSYGFTAGSYYRSKRGKNAFSSLVLGGYDASHFKPNKVTFQFAANDGRELVVAVQSITRSAGDTNTTLLPTALFAALDSTQPNLWLPLEACQQFERAFGLTWNETAQLYLVNDTLHDILVRESAVTTFRLGNAISGGPAVDIAFPYGSFDLTAEYPLVANSSRYFPLKRAANETQYTLGRAFLQEAYLIADYERHEFSISQCTWNSTAEQQIVTINSANSTSRAHGHRPNTAIILSSVIGAASIIVIFAVTTILCIRRRRQRAAKEHIAARTEILANKAMNSEGPYAEVDGSESRPVEVHGRDWRPELSGIELPVELSKERSRVQAYELPGDDMRYSELQER